jgi:hypothetical protein
MAKSIPGGQFTDDRVKAPLRLITAVEAGCTSPFESISSDTVATIRRLRLCSFIRVNMVIVERKTFQRLGTKSVTDYLF